MAVWSQLIHCQNEIIRLLDKHCIEEHSTELDRFNKDNWINRVWSNSYIRRAHVDVVDARETKGLWMMHVCVFPALGNNAPIFGFDVIAGKNKITGAFLDLSETTGGYDHEMQEWYRDVTGSFVPSKQRELPEWAKNIFSDHMIAAGNVQDDAEIDEIINKSLTVLTVYLECINRYVSRSTREETIAAQEFYCVNQKQNPHTPRVMASLGLDPAEVRVFSEEVLFPSVA